MSPVIGGGQAGGFVGRGGKGRSPPSFVMAGHVLYVRSQGPGPTQAEYVRTSYPGNPP